MSRKNDSTEPRPDYESHLISGPIQGDGRVGAVNVNAGMDTALESESEASEPSEPNLGRSQAVKSACYSLEAVDKASDSLGMLNDGGNDSSNESTDSVTSSSDSFLGLRDNLDHLNTSCKGDSLEAVIFMNEEERGLQDDEARVVKLLAALDSALETACKNALETSSKDVLETTCKDALGTSCKDALGTSCKDVLETSCKDALGTSCKDAIEISSKDALETACKDAHTPQVQDTAKGMTGLRITALLLLGLVEFLCGTALSILAPFYTSEAAKHGLSVTGSSLVFASVFILQVVFTPIFGRYILKLGSTRLLVAGSICSGLANIAFGFVPECRSVEVFFGMSLLLRGVTALGESAINTAVYPIARGLAPDRYSSTAMSCVETSFGLGTMTGPFFGGLLFKMGGFLLPFLVCGAFLVVGGLLAGILVFFVNKQELQRKHERNEEEEIETVRIKFRNVLMKPGILVTCVIIILTGMSTQWYQPTLEPFLSSHFRVTSFQASLFLVVDGAVYALFSPLWGILLDNKLNNRLLLVVGCSTIAVSFLGLGPVRIPDLPFIYQIGIGLAVHGIGMAANFIGTLTLLTNEIERSQEKKMENGQQINKIQSQGVAVSIWITFECIGSFIGSTLGGVTYDYYGWDISCLLVAVLQIFGLAAAIFYSLCERENGGIFKERDLESSLETEKRDTDNNNSNNNFRNGENRILKRNPSYGSNNNIVI